ncbi:type I polyketide synthase [Nitrosomonas sp. Nm166]|uniref:type I polyketide synthase n=1 Tax=Nitrosomonas sp. Nm166 TaxID=1881054 RepID=UPI0008ED9330|nr:type I polyketide synthase [Nitrosomonas sp. Nm166]SFF22999.1 Acyl transferase domain-containing protein [Nitrosomonas sp. Nm166]
MHNLEELPEGADLDIAIIGMACRFPGADDIESFWRNVKEGVESITFFTDEELLARGVPAETLKDSHYIKASAQLNDVDLFDASFFGYTPREAAETDPQHRLFLEIAWQALEDAGYDSSTHENPIGIYAGCGENTYLLLNLLPSGRMLDKQDISALQGLMNGNNKDSMTTTVAYKLNLRGPGITVQTACSTSLTATHMACRGLLNHEADMAIAGGVWINLLHENGYYYEPGAILSPDGHCRAFDDKAAGTVVGSGAGVVVLKRLVDALADGDTIHAVIKGSAINNDGSAKAGYTAPSVAGQADVILAAQAIAGIPADTISYIETHGTGTTLGDPIEVAALTQAFRESTDRRGFCGIGSVKTNVGHLDAAAGVAGLIKTALALKHQTLPPSLNFEQPNAQIDFSSSPFYVNTVSQAWPDGATPRRAGVSSFGIGGTNVHMIVEEAPSIKPSGPARDWQLLMVSAHSPDALEKAVMRLQDHIATHPTQPLADIAYTLQVGRKGFSHRAVVLCRDHSEAAVLLKAREEGCFLSQQVVSENRPVTFCFPGQGAQYIDMARDLYQHEPVFRQEFDRCLQLLKPHLDFDLFAILYPDTGETDRAAASARLEQTEVTQPALFVIEYALAQLWMSWGIKPTSMIGHSVGEYVAACLAQVFSLEDALRLVAVRGRLLQQMETGAMLAVMLPEAELAPYLNMGCDLAAVNGPALCVLSGPIEVIEQIEQQLKKQGAECRRLHVSHAFHSRMTKEICPVFVDVVAGIKPKPPKIPFFSNLSGNWITAQEATSADYWGRHLRGTVRFNDGLHKLLSNPAQVLLEVGPGETLMTLARRHPLAEPEHLMLSSLPHPSKGHLAQKHLYLSLGQLWLNGIAIDWDGFYTHENRHRVSLPTYPFERQSYWIKPEERHVAASHRAAINSNVAEVEKFHSCALTDWFYMPSWRRTDEIRLDDSNPETTGSYLIFKDEYGLSTALTEHLLLLGVNSIVVSAGTAFKRKNEHSYSVCPGEPQDFNQLLQGIRSDGKTICHVFHLWSLSAEDEARSQAESLARNFYSLLYLAKSLENNKALIPPNQKAVITIVTNQLQDVTGSEVLCPEKAMLYGPCKVIPQEYSYLSCRMIDVELRASNSTARLKLARQIFAESQAEVDVAMIAYRGPYRWIQFFEQVQHYESVKNRLKPGGVYLITGGLGGIGLTLAEYLARTQQAKLVLLGRSPVPARECWSEILSTTDKADPLRRKVENILQLEELGAKVLTLAADVSNSAELESAVMQARHQFGTIDGVIHAAGDVSDGLISLKKEETVARVLAPKVQGMQALQAIFNNNSLDFMLLCSSLASMAGGLSKIDYCAANAYLDASAHAAYRESSFPVISVNWDGWRDVGMAAGMNMPDGIGIAPKDGVEVFERIVNGPNIPQVIISTIDLTSRLGQTPDDLIAPSALFTTSTRIKRFSRPALQTIFKSPESELEISIAEIWQNLLGMESIGIDDNLFELGGDSLLGIQLLSRVRTGFAVELHPVDFFREPTIAALAAIVETKLLDEIECS